MKKLKKNESNSMVDGVLSGLADYYEIDVSILRIFYIILTLIFPVFMLLLYFIASYIIPDEDNKNESDELSNEFLYESKNENEETNTINKNTESSKTRVKETMSTESKEKINLENFPTGENSYYTHEVIDSKTENTLKELSKNDEQ